MQLFGQQHLIRARFSSLPTWHQIEGLGIVTGDDSEVVSVALEADKEIGIWCRVDINNLSCSSDELEINNPVSNEAHLRSKPRVPSAYEKVSMEISLISKKARGQSLDGRSSGDDCAVENGKKTYQRRGLQLQRPSHDL